MIRLALILLFLPCAIYAQTNYYLSPNGDDGNTGTSIEQAWGTPAYAFRQLTPGDTLDMLGGVYYSDSDDERIRIYPSAGLGASGTSVNRITVRGYADSIAVGSYPIIDCKNRCDSLTDPGYDIYNSGLSFTNTQYWRLLHFKVRNVFQCDSVITGAISGASCSNFYFEDIELYQIGQRGYWWTSGSWSYMDSTYAVDVRGQTPAAATPIFDQPDTTQWINCDTHDIYDTLVDQPGNAGDCWKVISYCGNYYYWEGCRAWYYSDDGFDPNGGKRWFKNCWAMPTRKYEIDDEWNEERNGFKTSSAIKQGYLSLWTPEDSALYVNDTMVRFDHCLALFGRSAAYAEDLESDTTDNTWYLNCTAYYFGNSYGNSIASYLDTIGTSFVNCISFYPLGIGASGQKTHVAIYYTPYYETNNTWRYTATSYPNFEDNPAFDLDSNDFVTTDSTTLVSLFTAPRQADGSLPVNRPLMLADDSDLIDGGTDVGLPYNGTAPDLGYSEYSENTIPVAAFSADNTTICKEDSVQFTDATTNTPLTWAWSFPGGSPDTSNLQNPKIEYPTAGTYTVSLYVTNADSSDTETKTNYITVRDSVVADFSASETSVNTGANISFTDLTTNNPSSWSWTFARGTPSVSTSQNPVVQYNTAGTYTVTLEATNTCNSDTEQKVGYITVSNPYAPAGNYRLTIKFR